MKNEKQNLSIWFQYFYKKKISDFISEVVELNLNFENW